MMTTRSAWRACAVVAVLAPTCGWAATMPFSAELSAQNEVPPTGTAGTGHLTASYDTSTRELSYKVEYGSLTGPATAAHFHGPAPKGQNASVVIPIAGPLNSPIVGKTALSDAQAKALVEGHLYFNIHTDAHKPGEIRGQVEQAQ